MPNIGPMEIVIVLIVLLLLFGPKRLPELGRSVGQGMRGFRTSLTGEEGGEVEASSEVGAPTGSGEKVR